MTTPGATEAVTPTLDQLATIVANSIAIESDWSIGSMHWAETKRRIVFALRAAEANALRRALYEVEYIERYEDSDRDVLLKYIATRIRSLLPKEAGK